MRETREILRQKWLLERPHRAVCASVGVSMGAVSQALKRAATAKLTWDAEQRLNDDELEARLYAHPFVRRIARRQRCRHDAREDQRTLHWREERAFELREVHPDGDNHAPGLSVEIVEVNSTLEHFEVFVDARLWMNAQLVRVEDDASVLVDELGCSSEFRAKGILCQRMASCEVEIARIPGVRKVPVSERVSPFQGELGRKRSAVDR